MSHSAAGSATAMIWQSSSCMRARAFVRPCPPTPMTATFTLSLGGTKRGPPSTWRGTMVLLALVALVETVALAADHDWPFAVMTGATAYVCVAMARRG